MFQGEEGLTQLPRHQGWAVIDAKEVGHESLLSYGSGTARLSVNSFGT